MSIANVLQETDTLEDSIPDIGAKYLRELRRFNVTKEEVFTERQDVFARSCRVSADTYDPNLSGWLGSFDKDKFHRLYVYLVHDHVMKADREGRLRSSTKRLLRKVMNYSMEHDSMYVFPIVMEKGAYNRFVMILPDDSKIPLSYTR